MAWQPRCEMARSREERDADPARPARGRMRGTLYTWDSALASGRRIAELSAITERLERVMPKSYIPVWLSKPLAALDDATPLDVIAAGEYKRVAKVISSIEDPGAV